MDSNFRLYLYHERANSLADHAKARVIGQSINSVLTFLVLRSLGVDDLIFVWLAIALASSIIMFFVTKALVPHKNIFTIQRWRIANMACAFCVGFTWSLAPATFFLHESVFFYVVIVSIYSGYVASSLAVSSIYRYSFVAFSLGITIPFVFRLFYEGGFDNNAIAVLMIHFIIMMAAVSTNMHKQFIKSVAIQYENERLIDQLDHEKNLAQAAVSSKDKFLAAASHDLRQPLNAIGLFSEALVPLQSETKGKQIVVKIRQSLTGLNRMLNALLDISRLDSDTVVNNPKHLVLHTIVNQLAEEYRHNAKKIPITIDLPSDVIVYADPTILYRILNNLLDNAIKYSNEGQINIECELSKTNLVYVKIIDSGIGIPEDKISIVFDEFHQLNNPERDREKGLGLGLAIVKRLCGIANIELNIESELNVGTEVKLALPQGLAKPNEHEDIQEPVVSLKAKYILVIDDEKNILEGMQYLLTSYGCDVVTADSQSNALVTLRQRNSVPDLIISDLRLREGLTGIDAIDAIRDEYNCDIPALLITGDTAPDKIIEAQQYSTLYKPVEPEELKLRINQLLNP